MLIPPNMVGFIGFDPSSIDFYWGKHRSLASEVYSWALTKSWIYRKKPSFQWFIYQIFINFHHLGNISPWLSAPQRQVWSWTASWTWRRKRNRWGSDLLCRFEAGAGDWTRKHRGIWQNVARGGSLAKNTCSSDLKQKTLRLNQPTWFFFFNMGEWFYWVYWFGYLPTIVQLCHSTCDHFWRMLPPSMPDHASG